MYRTALYTQPTLPRVLSSIQLCKECLYGLSNQLGEQVTSVNIIPSGPFLISGPVSSTGVATTGTVANTALTAPSGDNQSQCCHGKALPIDEFTGEDS